MTVSHHGDGASRPGDGASRPVMELPVPGMELNLFTGRDKKHSWKAATVPVFSRLLLMPPHFQKLDRRLLTPPPQSTNRGGFRATHLPDFWSFSSSYDLKRRL